MWTRQYRKSPLRHLVIPCIAAASLAYFGYHGITGNLGLTSKAEYEQRLAGLEAELDALTTARARLKTRTAALSDGSLQRDVIDEQARLSLGLANANELILLHKESERAATLDDLLQRMN
ncbi:MAG: septum formation initiator family protein [Roseitalea sp.]|jgi:cell division protein FtsB|nr:septum formation initiator family protein [Roseitalea sp.]MBO6722329.1 septum formation initiator family protein [Roseitalea sp.]MBO6744332.1 septum formation initiator family protein [Roseitalea sp.]